MAKNRMSVVDATVKKEMGIILSKEVTPLFSSLITITDVRTSPDLRDTRIYISVLGPDKEEVFRILNKKKAEFHRLLNGRVRMKYTPKIAFLGDDTPEKADYMTRLLDELDIPEDDDNNEA